LPLSIPVLISGAGATNAAIAAPMSFKTLFTIPVRADPDERGDRALRRRRHAPAQQGPKEAGLASSGKLLEFRVCRAYI
jgi:hypothetical protein